MGSMKCLLVLVGLILGILSSIQSNPIDSLDKNLYESTTENVLVDRMTRAIDDDEEADEDDGDKRQFICPHPNMIPPPINLAEVEKQRKYAALKHKEAHLCAQQMGLNKHKGAIESSITSLKLSQSKIKNDIKQANEEKKTVTKRLATLKKEFKKLHKEIKQLSEDTKKKIKKIKKKIKKKKKDSGK